MTARIAITTDRLPHKDLSLNARIHWSQRAKLVAAEKEYIHALVLENDPNCVEYIGWIAEDESLKFTKARISYEYHNTRGLDADNFLSRCKPWQDALVTCGFITDDKPEVLSLGGVEFVKCAHRGEEKVVITLEGTG